VYIDKHFGAVGGFSTRHSINEFVTVLPYSDLAEAETILAEFSKEFREEGIRAVRAVALRKSASPECVEFAVFAGLAQGQPIVELDSIIEFAKFQQKEIARLECVVGGERK
jgi:phospholipid/cholesterol/gamma-HCH transport system ATP-binding protein